jgi:hypothetical protein
MVFAVLLMVAGIALVSARASAALTLPGDPDPQPGAPGYLNLSESPDPLQFLDMSPGDVGFGEITVSLENAETARLALEMYSGGELMAHPNGVTMAIGFCDLPWTGMPAEPVSFDPADPVCADNPQPITTVEPGTETGGEVLFDLGTLEAGSPRYILVEVRMPDVSFIRWDSVDDPQIIENPAGAFLEVPPDLAVEVLSPSNTRREMEIKLQEYANAGVKLVWYVDPERKEVDVYLKGNPKRKKTLGVDNTLDGGDVLPGFTVKVAKLFESRAPVKKGGKKPKK